MASSGLWENVILTKTYLAQMPTIYVSQTQVPKGRKLAPTTLTNMKNEHVPFNVCHGGGWSIVGWWQRVI